MFKMQRLEVSCAVRLNVVRRQSVNVSKIINVEIYFDFQVLSIVAPTPRLWKTTLQLQEAKCMLRYHESNWLQYKRDLVRSLKERRQEKCCVQEM